MTSRSRYPEPDRSNFPPNQLQDDEIMPEGDLGAREGLLPDGRPYRAEVWYSEGYTYITLFFSALELEDAPPAKLLDLTLGVLEEARVPQDRRRLNDWDVHKVEDASGNIMYSLTFVAEEAYQP